MIVIIIGVLVTLVTSVPVFLQMRHHPRGLHILFFAEMWERFSYYGMRALLIFYLTQHFLFDDRYSQSQYGTYTALVYLLPLIGGFLSDKYLGNRKAIAFGALLLVAGHFTMGIEGPPATQVLTYQGAKYEFVVHGRGNNRDVKLDVNGALYDFGPTADGELEIRGLLQDAPLPHILKDGAYKLSIEKRSKFFVNILYLALALIIVGVGYLKANISSIVGQLYKENDPRRDPGFTLYYYGINLGAFWASVLCGYLGQNVGWWAGFGLAGVGMAFGWIVFIRRRLLFFIPGPPQLPVNVGQPPDPEKLAAPWLGPLSRERFIYLMGFVAVAVVWVLVQNHSLTGWLLAMGWLVFGGYVLYYMFTKCTRAQVEELSLAFILIVTSIVFWTLFEQAGSSLNQFADRNTILPNNGIMTVTASQVQSFNAGFILIFAPIFSALWAFLGRINHDPNTPLKFGLALIQVGLGFLILVWGANFADASYRVPMVFLALAYLLHTTGELCISPVGLSMITKLSPPAIVSFMMAGWFLSSSAAQFLGGLLAQFTAAKTVAGQVLDPKGALETYVSVFHSIGVWAIGIGLVMSALSFWFKRLGHGHAGRIKGHGVDVAGPEQSKLS